MATVVKAPTPVADVGLTFLSNPQDAVIDIVFVHGLQGHPQNTWTCKSKPAQSPQRQGLSSSKVSKSKKTRTPGTFFGFLKRKHPEPGILEEADVDQEDSTGEGKCQGKDVFWPRDLLKEDFPIARIMTFGYNTSITQGHEAANQGNIFSHARDLLYWLEAERRQSPNRDLVFIAHSLGGILVKEVLRRSEVDPDQKITKIFKSTTGVFFFGTPHRGSRDWASFGESVAVVAGRILGVDVNTQVIHALLPSGPELEICQESFTTQWVKRGNNLTVRTFQESKGVTGTQWGGFNQLIVPPDSSTLDHPSQHARTIDADHIGMVKFSGKNDKAYEMVKADIEELVIRAGKAVHNLVSECLRDLKLTNPSKDKQAIEEKDICIPNLCTWIFETSTFSNWQEDGKSNFFWLFGSAGKGKTWLAMRIISELESRSDNIVAYFFCDDKHDQRNKAAHVLRGLLWQLLQKDHQLFEFMRKDYIEHRKDLFEGSNLWQILEKFLAKLGERQIFFVIDGLDELEPKSCKMLLDKIVSLRSTNKSKWLLTGRKEGYIEECQKDDHLVVDLYDHECTVKEQVEKYIRIRLEELQERKCYDEEAKERMRINISQRSEGTFLWTRLVFRKIEEASKFTAETVVNGVPSGLNEYFKTMLQRIQRKPLADSALAVSILVATFFALQPLEVRDLMVVADLPQEKVKDEKDMLKLVGLCCSYLEVRAGKVSFVHQYAKDYLATDEAGLGLTKGSMSKQSEIAERCFRYTCENYKSPNTTAQMSYPALFWPSHAKAAANEFSSARETCFDFFLDDSEVRMNWFSRYWLVTEGSTDAPSGFTILHLAAYLGVSPWIKDDTRNLRFLNARDSHNTTPLMRAVHRQHCEAAHLLLEKGANTSIATTGGSTLLYRAVYNDDINMVKLLLSKTSSPLLQKFLEFMLGEGIKNVMLEWLTNLILHRFGTRLYWAAYYGKPAEMKRLLKGSGANASDRETPLSQAVAKGNTKIVKLLLGSAENPNGRQGEPTLYRTVFMSKEYPGMKEMVYELLDRGASVGREEPLYTAVWSTSSSSTEIVQLLLDYGANPNSKSHESPLYRATLYRDVKMVTKLLEKGAHPIADEYALYRAVCNENVSVVRLLLNHNADPNISCGDTPLLQAMWHEDDFATARLLLDAGARPTDSLGAPLIRALSNGDFEIAKLLVGKGANPNIDCGPSLLYHAQWHNILELTKSLLQRGAVTYGGSPLYLAVYHQNFELAKALLKNGADPNYAIGETPLWRAVMKNFPELVRLDLEYDACPDTPCHETPLLRACYNNNTEIAELLLCAGAHPEVVGGEFPIARATWNGNKDVQDLLLGKGAVGFDVHPPQRTPLYWAERHGNEYLASKLRVPYKEKPKRLFHLTHFTPSILASMILTILIIVLWYFHSYSLRLGAMFLFTMLLSVCLSLFMMAIRSKLLTTTIDSVFLKPLRLLRS